MQYRRFLSIPYRRFCRYRRYVDTVSTRQKWHGKIYQKIEKKSLTQSRTNLCDYLCNRFESLFHQRSTRQYPQRIFFIGIQRRYQNLYRRWYRRIDGFVDTGIDGIDGIDKCVDTRIDGIDRSKILTNCQNLSENSTDFVRKFDKTILEAKILSEFVRNFGREIHPEFLTNSDNLSDSDKFWQFFLSLWCCWIFWQILTIC